VTKHSTAKVLRVEAEEKLARVNKTPTGTAVRVLGALHRHLNSKGSGLLYDTPASEN